jgi:acyl-coenzyme A synthetase/AMP-(fatty) acid ligase/acyl carrier protein
VRLVYLAGDRLDWDDARAFQRHFPPGSKLYTGIGSTENATIFRQWFIDHDTPIGSGRPPVGRAIPERTVSLIGDDGRVVPPGEVGEIVVSSRYMALGYWRAEDLTRTAFVRDAHDPAARVFRTGDLGREREDGLLEFLGRKDHQVKIRGHRVEPAEIEAALKTHPSVAEAAVIVRDGGSTGNTTLAAYFEARKHVKVLPAGKSLASFLRTRLPAHMVPAAIMAIPRLPLLANFKIDRAQLARLDAMGASMSGTIVPGTLARDEPVAKAVRRVVAAVLDVKTVLPGDEMAALGADSLQLIQIALHLERQFGVELPADIYVPGLKVEDIVAGIERAREGRHV